MANAVAFDDLLDLPEITVEGFRDNITRVREWARMNKTQLSNALGRNDGFISDVERGAGTVDAELAQRVAKAVAGRHYLTENAGLIYLYLIGVKVDVADLLPGLLGGSTRGRGEDPRLDSAAPGSTKGGSLSHLADYRTPNLAVAV